MFKVINFSGDTIRLDECGVSQTVTASCRRSGSIVEGIVALDDAISLVCSEKPDDFQRSYRFTALGYVSYDEICAVLRSRYDSGFRTVGVFLLDDGYWSLTEKILFDN